MKKLDTTCPKCGAPHARKLSVIHAEGLSTVETEINTVGTFNTIGGQQITTEGNSSSVQQTRASREAAPPEMPRIVTKGMHNRKMLILAGIATCLVGLWLFSMLVVLCGVAMIVGAFMLDTDPSIAEQSDYDEQTRDIREAIEAWEQTFQCVSCGNRFVPLEIAA